MLLVKKGVRWNVGDGNWIKVLSDPWISDVPAGTVQTLVPLPNDIQVIGTDFGAFLGTDGQTWDSDLVRATFAEATADKILQLPINRHADGDYLSWPHNKFGCYTVRPAYNLASPLNSWLIGAGQGVK